MDINLIDEKIVELKGAFSDDELQERAMAKRIDAFGQLARFVQRPRPEEIEIVETQKRFEPFWYGSARSHYLYDRRQRYQVAVSPEVQSVSFQDQDHPVQQAAGKNRTFVIEGMDHCLEEEHRELMLDAARGEERDFSRYLVFERNEVPNLQALCSDRVSIIAPEIRSSFVVRKLVASLMKTFQADRVLEERIDVEEVALYFRPVYAVEFYWKPKDKRAVVEFDGLTGEARAEPGQIKKRVVNVLENDALFDIGADAVGAIFPGVNVAVKLGRLAARKVVR